MTFALLARETGKYERDTRGGWGEDAAITGTSAVEAPL